MVAIADDAPRAEAQPSAGARPRRIGEVWPLAVALMLVVTLVMYLLAAAFAGPR